MLQRKYCLRALAPQTRTPRVCRSAASSAGLGQRARALPRYGPLGQALKCPRGGRSRPWCSVGHSVVSQPAQVSIIIGGTYEDCTASVASIPLNTVLPLFMPRCRLLQLLCLRAESSPDRCLPFCRPACVRTALYVNPLWGLSRESKQQLEFKLFEWAKWHTSEYPPQARFRFLRLSRRKSLLVG